MNFRCQSCEVTLAASEFDVGAKAKCPACGDAITISLPKGARTSENYTNGRALGSFLFAVFAAISLAFGYYVLYVRAALFDERVHAYVVYSAVGAVMAGLFFSVVLGVGAFRVIKQRGGRERGKGYAGWGLFLSVIMLLGLAYCCYTPVVHEYAALIWDKIQSLFNSAG